MGFLEEDLLEAEKNKSKTGVALARRGMTLPRLKRWEEPGCEGLDVALQTFSLYFCQMKKGGGDMSHLHDQINQSESKSGEFFEAP